MNSATWTLWFGCALLVGACAGDGGTKDAVDGDDDDDTAMVVGDDDDDDDSTGGVPIVECEDAFDPCGGDPTGTWNVEAVCDIDVDLSALNCGEASYEITGDRSSGTITMDAAGLYDREYVIDVDFELTVPDSCLVGPITCDNLAMLSQGLLDSCQTVATDCVCTGQSSGSDSYAGTYVVENGNTVVTDGNDRTEFCITGNFAQSREVGSSDRIHWQR